MRKRWRPQAEGEAAWHKWWSRQNAIIWKLERPFSLHLVPGIRHRLRDCRACPEVEKKAHLEQRVKELAKDGPLKTKHGHGSQKGKLESQKTVPKSQDPPKTGHLQTPPFVTDKANCNMILSDESTALNVIDRCEDGSDYSLAYLRVAESSVLRGIGKIKWTDTVKIQVALRQGDSAQTFKFLYTWSIPRTVLILSSERLALRNISFLVADDNLACEDILIGCPVLQHIRIDSKTLLNSNYCALDGTDC